MIWRKIRQNTHGRIDAWCIVQLKRRQLERNPCRWCITQHYIGERYPNIARIDRVVTERSQEMANEGRRCRLAVSSSHSDIGNMAHATKCQFDFADDVDVTEPRYRQGRSRGCNTRTSRQSSRAGVGKAGEVVPPNSTMSTWLAKLVSALFGLP